MPLTVTISMLALAPTVSSSMSMPTTALAPADDVADAGNQVLEDVGAHDGFPGDDAAARR